MAYEDADLRQRSKASWLPKDIVKQKMVLRGVGSTSSSATKEVKLCGKIKVVDTLGLNFGG